MAEERKIVFRFQADAEKVKKAYAETKGMIKSLKAQLKAFQSSSKKMTDSMQKETKETTKEATNRFKKFVNNTKKFFKDMNAKYGETLTNMSVKTTTMTTRLMAVFRRLAFMFAAAFSIYALINFGKEAIALASDLEEVQNVVDVSFGDMKDQVEDFSKSAMKNFGLTELQAKQMSSTFMSMGKGMGINGQVGTNMALALTGLVGDVSSFRNISASEAQTALNAIYTGETESLKKLGVAMTEVNLKQFAMSKGMNSNLQAMSQQEKVMLRYNFVINSLKDAQGDFARTSNSWANQVRQLSGLWTNFKAIVGNSLKTVFTPLLTVFNKILSDLTGIASILNNSIIKMNGGIVQSSAKAAASINATTSELLEQSDALNEVSNSAEGLASFDKINTIGNEDSGTANGGYNGIDIGETIGSEIGVVTQEANAFSIITDKLLAKWEFVKKTFKDTFKGANFGALKTSFSELGIVGGNAFDFLIEKLAIFSRWFLEKALPYILDFASAAIPVLMQIIDAVDWELWGTLFIGALKAGTIALEKIGQFASENEEIFAILVNLVLAIVVGLKFLIPIITTVIAVATGISTIIPIISSVVTAIGGFIGSISLTAVAMGAAVIAIVAGIWWIYDNWDMVVENISFLFEYLVGLIKLKFEDAKSSISNFIGKMKDGFTNFKTTIANIFNSIPNLLKNAVNLSISILNKLIDKVNGFSITIPSKIPGIGGESIGMSIPNIPMLANGGVVTQPTIAGIGEYKGARTNPEIVSPENKLRNIYREENAAMTGLLSQILQAILMLDPSFLVQIGDKDVEAIITKIQNKQNYRRNPRTT